MTSLNTSRSSYVHSSDVNDMGNTEVTGWMPETDNERVCRLLQAATESICQLLVDIRVNRAERAIFEAALGTQNVHLSNEILALRVWRFISWITGNEVNQFAGMGASETDLKILRRGLIDWSYRNVIKADRGTRIGVAIFFGGKEILEERELLDLPEDLVQYLSEEKRVERAALFEYR